MSLIQSPWRAGCSGSGSGSGRCCVLRTALEDLYSTLLRSICLARWWSFKARRVSGTRHAADSEMLSRGRAWITMGLAVDPSLAVLHHRSDLGHRKCTDG